MNETLQEVRDILMKARGNLSDGLCHEALEDIWDAIDLINDRAGDKDEKY